jgi:hypothetical protein
VQPKVQLEQKWTRKSAISVRAAKIAGTTLPSTEPAIGNVAVVEPPLVIHDTQPQDPQPPQRPLHAPPADLDLPLHPHPIVEPGPHLRQVEPISTQANTVLPPAPILSCDKSFQSLMILNALRAETICPSCCFIHESYLTKVLIK